MTMKLFVLALALTALSGAASTAFANAPGGTYVQCDPHNPNSPVRCKPDGW